MAIGNASKPISCFTAAASTAIRPIKKTSDFPEELKKKMNLSMADRCYGGVLSDGVELLKSEQPRKTDIRIEPQIDPPIDTIGLGP